MGQSKTLLGTVTQLDMTYYKQRFLDYLWQEPVLYNHGQAATVEANIPMNSGSTINFFRYHPLARKTAGRSEGKTTYTAQSLEGMTTESGVEIWDSVVTYSEKTFAAGRDKGMLGGAQVLGRQAGESLEQETMKIMAESGIWPFPRNAYNASSNAMVASFYKENIAATKTGTTTTFISTNLASLNEANLSNDVLIGAWGCVSKGRGYGHGFRITSYDSDGGGSATPSFLFTPAAPEALTSEVGYISNVTIGIPNHTNRPINSGDTMTTGFLLKAKAVLKRTNAKRFPDGTYHCFMDPDITAQLMALDTTWKNHMTESRPEKGENGELGRWAGITFYECNITPRYPIVANTANAISFTAGNMYVSLLMGIDSFGKVGIGGWLNDPKLIFKDLTSGGVSNPTESYGTMAWKIVWKIKPLNANWCLGLMTYMA